VGVHDIQVRMERVSEPVLAVLVGFPDAGLVGVISSSQIIDSLGMRGIGWIDVRDVIPPTALIHNGFPEPPVQIYEGGGLIVVTAGIPVPLEASRAIGDAIFDVARRVSSKSVLIMGGLPSEERYESEDLPKVFFASSEPEAATKLAAAGAQPMEGGLLVGANAHLLMEGYKEKEGIRGALVPPAPRLLAEGYRGGIEVNALYADAFPKMPDPGAAAQILSVVSKLYGVPISTDKLTKQSEEIRLKTKQLMQQVSSAPKAGTSFMYT